MPRCSRCGKNPVVTCDDALSRAYCVHAIKPAEPETPDLDAAYVAGKRASSLTPGDNPYSGLTHNAECHAWLRGWMDAHPDDPFTVARRRT